AQDKVHVLIGKRLRLLLQLVVDLSLRQMIRICQACAAGKDIAERVDLVLQVRVARSEVLEHLVLVELPDLGKARIGKRNENAAANVADKIDESGNLVVLLHRQAEIRCCRDRDKDERDKQNLKDSDHRCRAEAQTEIDMN